MSDFLDGKRRSVGDVILDALDELERRDRGKQAQPPATNRPTDVASAESVPEAARSAPATIAAALTAAARAHGDHDWPASPLSTHDALGYSRDASELARSQGMSLAQRQRSQPSTPHELTSSPVSNDSPNEPPAPVASQLCACGAAYGRWSKVHWKPDAKQGDRPCEGSW
jgi:hypothetical protein